MKPEMQGFRGLRVLSLESRRQREIARLISNHNGTPIVAPSVRELPTVPNTAVSAFLEELLEERLDAMVFMTGVGTRALAQAAQMMCPVEKMVAGLRRLKVVARSHKPAEALRELKVPITLLAPEPNTWEEILQVLDANPDGVPLRGSRVAIQEHGVPSDELVAGLIERGASVLPVQVYRWSLPEDLGPLQQAIWALVRGQVDVALFTACVQIQHLVRVAERMRLRKELLRSLSRTVVASIGPVTSAELRRWNIPIDIEPAHPKMGLLVREAAERSAQFVAIGEGRPDGGGGR